MDNHRVIYLMKKNLFIASSDEVDVSLSKSTILNMNRANSSQVANHWQHLKKKEGRAS